MEDLMEKLFHILTLFIFWEHPNNKMEDNLRKLESGEMKMQEFILRTYYIKYPY